MEPNKFKRTATSYIKKNKEPVQNTTPKIQMSEKLNHNNTKFKTPMGSSGHLVGVFPVVLSEFETDIHCELKYKSPIKSIISKQNKIIVKKFKFISNNQKLLIDGYIEKNIFITFNNNSEKQSALITIPFKTIVDITYSIPPNYDTEYKTISKGYESCESFFSPAEKVFLVHEYTKLKENVEEIQKINSKEYLMKLVVTLGISLIQKQKVFIPEASGEADVIAEYDNCKVQKKSNEISHIEIGHNSKKGLIARIIKE